MQEPAFYPDRNKLNIDFERYADLRKKITRELEYFIEEILEVLPSQILIKARTKDFDSYYRKYLKILRNDLEEGKSSTINDLIGIRIVCPFIEDIELVEKELEKHVKILEVERKGANQTFKEFGYQSTHLLIEIPQVFFLEFGEIDCKVAEVQIRTILQDAWAEVEHELIYKSEFTPLDNPIKRKLAALNANLSLADIYFQEIRVYQRDLTRELDQRRDSFFKKIEDITDEVIFCQEETEKNSQSNPELMAMDGNNHKRNSSEALAESSRPFLNGITIRSSMDDLLLKALSYHNAFEYAKAIESYTQILDMNPAFTICSLVLRHRGMAYFSQSLYQDAICDFTHALELDPKSYKIFYYRGIIYAVIQNYSAAIDDFIESLKENPYQPYCLYRRGQVYYHLADYPHALADCDAALALDPSIKSIQLFRKIIHNKLKM